MSQTRASTPSTSPLSQPRPTLRSQVTIGKNQKKIQEAESFLAKHKYLPARENSPPNRTILYNVIDTITDMEKKDFTAHFQIYNEAIKHAITLLKANDEEYSENKIAEAINKAFDKVNSASKIEEKLNSVQEDIYTKLDEMTNQLKILPQETGPRPTYAEITTTQSFPPKLSPELNRQRLRSHVQVKTRQLLFRINADKPPHPKDSDKPLTQYDDPKILELFNSTLKEIDAPEEFEFVTASKYKNSNNILTEMNNANATKWLRNIINSIQFETTMNNAVDLIQREYGVAINFGTRKHQRAPNLLHH
ncbi:hypothetical protein K435DRAFT_881199 [Dendrothele bispora CBS 962.96]|uniref:Uncharacterized protein n=1 Tax=Dendrothele bispora (strain CBS 962.96) TaxID=1314807 RepID=A0A4S8KIK5_DENBC|nr:hypothetical protein K435DRAFT_881199 [Dendrothele bispora CBS 962.96]